MVAADGIHSHVRRSLWEDPGHVTYSGITAWRAVTPEPWPEELTSGISWGRGQEFGAVELGDGRVYWFGAVNAPRGERAADEMAEVRRIFGHWHDPVPGSSRRPRPSCCCATTCSTSSRCPPPSCTGGWCSSGTPRTR